MSKIGAGFPICVNLFARNQYPEDYDDEYSDYSGSDYGEDDYQPHPRRYECVHFHAYFSWLEGACQNEPPLQ